MCTEWSRQVMASQRQRQKGKRMELNGEWEDKAAESVLVRQRKGTA